MAPAKSGPATARSAATPVMSAPVPGKPAAAGAEFVLGGLRRGPSHQGGGGMDALTPKILATPPHL